MQTICNDRKSDTEIYSPGRGLQKKWKFVAKSVISRPFIVHLNTFDEKQKWMVLLGTDNCEYLLNDDMYND